MSHNSDPSDSRRVLITGATGLVGTALKTALAEHGYKAISLVRKKEEDMQDAMTWNPKMGFTDEQLNKIEGVEAVVNLAGEPIFGRFTDEKKKRIRESRIDLTEKLADGLMSLLKKPRVLISASASGIYAPYDGRDQDELAPLGDDFLSGVCRDWEAAAQPAAEAGIRLVHLRIAPVLSTKGGMLKVMLVPARLNLIGRVGSGEQYVSWIALEDLVSLIIFCLDHNEVSGPVNAAAPNAVTNAEFTETLVETLHKWQGPPVPEFAAKLALGKEAAEEMVLQSLKVVPRHALDAGFKFSYPKLNDALKHIIANNV